MLITYMIEIPEEHVTELSDFMLERNIAFNHHADITGSHPERLGDAVLMSGDAVELRGEINRHLGERRIQPEVPGPVASWSVPTIQSFMDMAACNFRWRDGRITSDMDQGTWEIVVRDTRRVFGGEEE